MLSRDENLFWVAYYGSIDVALYVLLEIASVGKIEQIEFIRSVARQEGNIAICRLLDLYNNGSLELFSDSCAAFTSRMLQVAFSIHPILRAHRAVPRAAHVSDWSTGLYVPASALAAKVIPMSHRQRQLVLPRCGLLQTLVYRLACSFTSPLTLEYESRSYSSILRHMLNVAFARMFLRTFLKSYCLQSLDVAPASRHAFPDPHPLDNAFPDPHPLDKQTMCQTMCVLQ